MEKSHVSMEQQVCMVCGATFDTGAILLDRRLRPSMERHTTTGIGMCPEHQKLKDEGYVALIGVDPTQSVEEIGGTMKTENAHRTGRIAHVRGEVWDRLFNVKAPPGGVCFVEDEVLNLLERQMAQATE